MIGLGAHSLIAGLDKGSARNKDALKVHAPHPLFGLHMYRCLAMVCWPNKPQAHIPKPAMYMTLHARMTTGATAKNTSTDESRVQAKAPCRHLQCVFI
jgi:hypothetical protein